MDAEWWRAGPPRRARRHGRPAVAALGHRRAGPRRQPGRAHVLRRLRLRQGPVPPRAPTEQKKLASTGRRPPVGRHHGADRARRRLRRRRRPHQGRPAARRHLAHRGRQALHHLGRARPHRQHRPLRAGPARGRRPRHQGLSLFIVPKFHVDLETGELGERNGAFVTNVEHKMGLKVSTTCELRFGEQRHPRGRHAARRRARRHRADVQDHRVRPDDGRHQGDRHAVHRLPQRAGVRQAARAGRRPDPDDRQGRPAGHDHRTTRTSAAR